MKQLFVILVMCALANAGTPTLTTYDAKAFTLSMPKGWTIVADASKGTVVAQQDPKRKDAAQMLVLIESGSTTDDQLLDGILEQAMTNPKVVKREPLPGGTGKLLVADGTTDNLKVRLGAIALAGSGGVVVGVLISKVGDFDALGGASTVLAVLGSIKLAAGAPTAPTTITASSEVMTPHYDAYHTLLVQPPRRAITQADMAGDWKVDANAVQNYVAISTGGYAGYSVVVVNETYSVDATGTMSFKTSATQVSTKHGASQSSDAGAGTFTIDADRTITIAEKGKPTKYYVLRGWFVGPEVTIMRINGPYWKLDQISANVRADRSQGLDNYFVRKTR